MGRYLPGGLAALFRLRFGRSPRAGDFPPAPLSKASGTRRWNPCGEFASFQLLLPVGQSARAAKSARRNSRGINA